MKVKDQFQHKILKFENDQILYDDEFLKVYPVKVLGNKEPCFSFICEPKISENAGIFNPQKAQSIKGLTVESYVKLQRGFEVTLASGRVVLPSEVLDERERDPIQCAAFIFMPDESYIDHFVKEIHTNAFKDFSVNS